MLKYKDAESVVHHFIFVWFKIKIFFFAVVVAIKKE